MEVTKEFFRDRREEVCVQKSKEGNSKADSHFKEGTHKYSYVQVHFIKRM